MKDYRICRSAFAFMSVICVVCWYVKHEECFLRLKRMSKQTLPTRKPTKDFTQETRNSAVIPTKPPAIKADEALYTVDGHDHLAADRLDPSGLAPLTQWVQREIHKNQHPRECNQILVTDGWSSGFGSELHVIGSHLALAIEKGWPLVWGDQACLSLSTQTCGSSRCACFFRELSSCKADQTSIHINNSVHQTLIPTRFRSAMKRSLPGITDAQLLYWWRAQSVGYLARLNRETVEEVRRLRLNSDLHVFSRPPSRSFPLPAGTINAHIRGGDKHKEMKLVLPNAYVRAAVELVQHVPLSFLSRTLFVSGDSLQLVQQCGGNASAQGWSWLHSKISRMDGGFAHSSYKHSRQLNRRNFTLQVLLQLQMSLEADGWVGTRGSNWNRLIDELRCVWVDKCGRPYVEVGEVSPVYFW